MLSFSTCGHSWSRWVCALLCSRTVAVHISAFCQQVKVYCCCRSHLQAMSFLVQQTWRTIKEPLEM